MKQSPGNTYLCTLGEMLTLLTLRHFVHTLKILCIFTFTEGNFEPSCLNTLNNSSKWLRKTYRNIYYHLEDTQIGCLITSKRNQVNFVVCHFIINLPCSLLDSFHVFVDIQMA